MLKFFRKIAIMLLFVVVGSFTVSFLYEIAVMDDSRMKLEVAIKLASNDALGRFQSLYATSNDYFDAYSADDYLAYLNSIETQAQAQGLRSGNSDIYDIIAFLRMNAHTPNANYSFSPLQFDWTFLDERGLGRMFDIAMRDIVDYNLGVRSISGAGGFELAEVRGTQVEITGPILLDLTESANKIDFAQIFGTSQRAETLKNINNGDAYDVMYNYVIAYDCTFTLTWRHHTRSPFYQGIEFDMPPVVLHKRYIVTN